MNSQTTPITSTILRNKLGRLAIQLQQEANPLGTNMSFGTLEQVIGESIKILSQFYKQLSEPSYEPINIVVDTLPDITTFNKNFTDIYNDFVVAFMEFENLEGVILGGFNYMVSRLNRLNRKLKSVYSQLGDYILLSNLPTKDAIFFGDSFNNLDRVESMSPLLNSEQCEINQVEGIATLPVDKAAQKILQISEIPVINSNSNGRSGNNEEANAILHGNISDILDNNADTWFEYERTLYIDDGIPLILDLTINLGEPKIINFIRINPNNFGTKTEVNIVNIDTSIDGNQFISIKDDIPITGFIAEDEANIFKLASSTSKFAGQGLFTFTARKAKYIHLTLKQISPYRMTLASGATKLRYAIGIRDVDIQALPYKPQGEVISTNYEVLDDVKKVVLLTSQNPLVGTVSTLASIDHFISPDNGISWYQIRPKADIGVANTTQTVSELLDFNGVNNNSITIDNTIRTIRYKAVLKRNTEAFVDSTSELAQEIADISELHTPPSTTPFFINLKKTPIKDTIRLIDPLFGSRGKTGTQYKIASGTGGALSILLPFKPLIHDHQKVETSLGSGVWNLRDLDPQVIYVDGIEWTKGILSGLVNHYRINFEEGKITFGDGTNGNFVTAGGSVSMILSEERLFPARGEGHITILDYPTSNDKKQMEIYTVDPPKYISMVLKKGAVRHPLQPDIVPGTIKANSTAIIDPATREDFIDGSTELDDSTKWSCDYTNGVLYLHDDNPTLSNTDLTVTFQYYPRTQIQEYQWDFINNNGISNSLSISDGAYKMITPPTFSIPSGVNYFNLPHMTIVQGSIKFLKAGITPTSLATEVPFIDGRIELLSVIKTTEELAPITGITTPIIKEITFKMKITTDTSFSVVFENQSVFIEEQSAYGNITDLGDYYIDRSAGSTGTIYIKLAANVTAPGDITYYYINSQANLTGKYSINYKTGEVFCYTATASSTTVDYKYTNLVARYNIARFVPSDDWEFDTATNQVNVKDREILNNMMIPQKGGNTGNVKFYQVIFQYIKAARANVSELEPFFSPVLKDYAVKVITKSRLA